ncbi:MAG: Gfo/Idh/MocA family protein [Planctomycetota bacterium]
MRISFHGKPTDEPEIRAGFIGCGSHAFRNVYPTFQFTPVHLVATCDLDRGKAVAFAAQFGAERAYDSHREMLEAEALDAVFIVVGGDEWGRPAYPPLAIDCLEAGCHVWMEKPPAASCAEVEAMQRAADAAGRHVMVGLKKMFFPANEKAKELIGREDFGEPSLVLLQYPQYVPTQAEFDAFRESGEVKGGVRGFLDHLCHPVSLLLFLLGMPESLSYERSASGAGVATLRFASGAVASLALTCGSSRNAGMERTTVVGQGGHHLVVDNGLRVFYHRSPPNAPGTGYGSAPDYFTGSPEDVSAVWEPEFSLGQLYNKGLFLLGYYGEVEEFARSVLAGRPPAKATLEHAWQVTRIFEAFAEGPGQRIPLPQTTQE